MVHCLVSNVNNKISQARTEPVGKPDWTAQRTDVPIRMFLGVASATIGRSPADHLPSTETRRVTGPFPLPIGECDALREQARQCMGSGSDGRRRAAAGRSRAPRKSVGHPDGSDADTILPRSGDGAQIVGLPQWHDGNRILASLPPDELAVVGKSLTSVSLASGQILYEQHGAIDWVYFPDTSVVSFLSRVDSAAVEVGTIGNEGGAGLALFLGVGVSIPEAIVQIPGDARRMSAAAFLSAVSQLPRFRDVVARCTHAFMTQVSQTAACNRLHGIEQRCARWLLLTHDRVGGADTFPLTHQFLSFMLGVRRAGVTEALGALGRSALIKSTSGHITILDRQGLEAFSCECYAIVRRYAGEPFDELPDLVRLRTKNLS